MFCIFIAIPPLPSQIILSEADELLLNCTPTTTSSLVMVLFNGNAIAMVPGLFRTSRVELADSGIYTCVGYNGSVVRSTEVIVFSSEDCITITSSVYHPPLGAIEEGSFGHAVE